MSVDIGASYSAPLKKYFGEVSQVFRFKKKEEDLSTAKTIAIALSVLTVVPFLIAALLLGVTLGLEKIGSLCGGPKPAKEKIEGQQAAHLLSPEINTPFVSTIGQPASGSSRIPCNRTQMSFLREKSKEFCAEIEDERLSSQVNAHLTLALNDLEVLSSSQLNMTDELQALLTRMEKKLPSHCMQKVRDFFCRYFPKPDQFSEMRRDFLMAAFEDFFEHEKEHGDMDPTVCDSVGFFRGVMWDTWGMADFKANPQRYVDKWRSHRPLAVSNRKFQEFLRIHYPPVW